jgi:hypothetical protein
MRGAIAARYRDHASTALLQVALRSGSAPPSLVIGDITKDVPRTVTKMYYEL